MNCPVCKETTLVMTNRQGIELDYCPQCRGVWLDRGELDKIVEREAAQATTSMLEANRSERGPRSDERYRDDDYYRDRDDDYRDDRHKRRRGGFFRELLDFD